MRVRTLVFTCITVVGVVFAPGNLCAQVPLDSHGQWIGPWNWSAQLDNPPPPTGCESEWETIGHAALIPTGLHRGKVLLWNVLSAQPGGACGPTTKTWILDPARPTELIEIVQSPSVFTTNVFCSAFGWDPDGNLVVAGGEDINPSPGSIDPTPVFPKKAYRFLPGALGPVAGTPPSITASPWVASGDMAIARNYATFVTLNRFSFAAVCGADPLVYPSYAGGGALVLGGRATYDEGNEIYDFLRRRAPVWSCALKPLLPVVPYPYAFDDHTATIGSFPTVSYHPSKPAPSPGSAYPEVDFESYPRAFQISTGEVVVAGDVDKLIPNPVNAPGDAWVVKPHYSVTAPGWELWRAPQTTDRQLGSAVIMYVKNPTVAPFFHDDRILVIGGLDSAGSPGVVLDTVQEYIPGTDPTTGTWQPKASLNFARWHDNAVVLPTGKIFVHGGTGPHTSGSGPAYTPELYDPGRTPTDSGSTTNLIAPAIPVPRQNHQVTLLLPDARVFVAGGDQVPGAPESAHSGDIYEPPYLFYGFRPIITSAPASADFNPAASPTFTVSAQHAAINSIERVVLIRPGASTHNFDNDQRYIELDFTSAATSSTTVDLSVIAPHESLGPQGIYMLFVLEKQPSTGRLAPSVAAFIDMQ